MIINHNMMSMNAQRSLGVNSSGLGKSTEQLSTGPRENRAPADAAARTKRDKETAQGLQETHKTVYQQCKQQKEHLTKYTQCYKE